MASRKKNAKTIVRVGKKMGASDRAIKAALAAGLVESNLRNVNYGDRDSLGVFQQRPSQGWGSPRQVRNVRYAAKQFYKRAIPIERKYNTGALAQAVQRSAFPARYSQRGREAQDLLNRYGKTSKEVTTKGRKRVTTTTTKTVIPGQDFSEQRKQAKLAYLQSRGDPSALLGLASSLRELKDVPQKTKLSKDRDVDILRRRRARKSRKGVTDGGGYAGTEKLAGAARRTARRTGHPIVSQKRSTRNTASGNVSDHFVGNKRAWAVDIGARGPGGARLAKKLARTYGIKGNVIGTYQRHPIKVNGRKYSVQILWNVPDHYDHVHIGFKRL